MPCCEEENDDDDDDDDDDIFHVSIASWYFLKFVFTFRFKNGTCGGKSCNVPGAVT